MAHLLYNFHLEYDDTFYFITDDLCVWLLIHQSKQNTYIILKNIYYLIISKHTKFGQVLAMMQLNNILWNVPVSIKFGKIKCRDLSFDLKLHILINAYSFHSYKRQSSMLLCFTAFKYSHVPVKSQCRKRRSSRVEIIMVRQITSILRINLLVSCLQIIWYNVLFVFQNISYMVPIPICYISITCDAYVKLCVLFSHVAILIAIQWCIALRSCGKKRHLWAVFSFE